MSTARPQSGIHRPMRQKLLREYVESLVLEFMDNSMLIGDPDKASEIFIGPFRNLAGITIAELGKTISTAKMAARLAWASVKGAFGFKADYDKVFTAHDQETKSIQSKFQKYYDDAFSLSKNTDLNIISFMWNPGAYIVAKASMQPSAAASITGAGRTAFGVVRGGARKAGETFGTGGYYYYESALREGDQGKKQISPDEAKKLQAASEQFRKIEEKKVDEVIQGVKEAMAMPPGQFMETYGKDDAQRKEQYDQLKGKLMTSIQSQAKEKEKVLSQETLAAVGKKVDETAAALESQLGAVVSIAKKAMRDSRANMLDDEAEKLEQGLKSLKVDPNDHGLPAFLRGKAAEIRAIKASAPAQSAD